MGRIYSDITELIGSTPLMRLSRYKEKNKLSANILAKLERQNPFGSAKDRIALRMILEARRQGRLKENGLVIEPTSGNTGIALAAIASVLGYRMVIVMPDTMSVERRKIIAAYGAEIVLTPGAEGMQGSINKAREINKSTSGSIIIGQFENAENPAAHFETTGPEIWRDTCGQLSVFVATVGTGGTITGAGKYLKSMNPDIRVVAVEPLASPLLSEGRAGSHTIQGIGANFIPEVLDLDAVDEIVRVSDEDALTAMKALASAEGLLSGISSGAALAAAAQIGRRPQYEGANIAVILPDTGERYLSCFEL